MSIHQAALWAVQELSEMINAIGRKDYCRATLEQQLREVRGALRHDLNLPDNCPSCEGIGGKTLEDGCYQDCFECGGSGKVTEEKPWTKEELALFDGLEDEWLEQ